MGRRDLSVVFVWENIIRFVYVDVRRKKNRFILEFSLRHGPFDILGGGGAGIYVWAGIFFGQYRSKVIFFAGVTTNNDPH